MHIDSNSFPVDPRLPTDQAMLLRLIDAKFETTGAKLDGISNTLTAMNERFSSYDEKFSDHEHRIAAIEGGMQARQLQVKDFEETKQIVKSHGTAIGALERWQTEEQTTSRNASKWGGVIWGAVGSGVTAGAMFLASMFFQAQPASVVTHEPPKTEVTHTETTGRSTTQVVPQH